MQRIPPAAGWQIQKTSPYNRYNRAFFRQISSAHKKKEGGFPPSFATN